MNIRKNDIEVEIINARNIYKRIAQENLSTEDAYSIRGTAAYELDNGYLGFLSSIYDIEVFVLEVLSSNELAFNVVESRLGNGHMEFDGKHPLIKYFHKVVKFADYYKPDFSFSEHVQLFFDCWIVLELHQVGFNKPSGDSSKPAEKQYQVFNSFLDLIRTKGRSAEFRKRLSWRKDKSSKRFRSAKFYIDRLFVNCSRMEVLRIDFSYRQEFAHRITAEQAMTDFKNFKNNWRGKPSLFQYLEGHIWKLEWGPGKGLHFHLILFFDSAKVKKDVYLAEQIGKYWVECITKGTGHYWNCNASKHKYRKLGIGKISADDEELRKNLIDEVVGYLVKTEQYLRAAPLGKGKLFGHGEIKVKSPAGRPRKNKA